MADRFEVIEFRPSERSCHVLCSSARRDDADRIVAALLKSDPKLRLHINKSPSAPQRKKNRERGSEL